MSENGYPHGAFCWAELATPDVATAKNFYALLFDWGFADTPMAPNEFYTMMCLDEGTVGGLYAQSAEMRAAGAPPCWIPYVSVNDLDAVTNLIVSLGGSIIAPPFDVADTGRMATIADPQGAVLNLWSRESSYAGADRLGPLPGTVCWNELATSDLDGAASFYSALFGWGVKEMPTPEHDYVAFMLEGAPVGGMLPASVAGPNVPPHWMIYFAVPDCDAAVATAVGSGGRMCKSPFEVPDVGRIAVLADPFGAAFAVIALSKPA